MHIILLNRRSKRGKSYWKMDVHYTMTFHMENGGKYGIRMDQLVIGGLSAGGQLAGQFMNIQTNPAYAKEMGMKAILGKGDVKAMLFHSALLEALQIRIRIWQSALDS